MDFVAVGIAVAWVEFAAVRERETVTSNFVEEA